MEQQTTDTEVSNVKSGQREVSWININDEYLLPRSFLENCVVFVQRSGSTVLIRTTEDYNDLTIVLPDKDAAVSIIKEINRLLNVHDIQCNIEFNVAQMIDEGV